MIKLSKILSELEVTDGHKFVKGNYSPRSKEELRELESLVHLEVTDNLDLFKTQITKLPDNLQVGGNLNLFKTPITELPNNLKVGGDLILSNTPLVERYTNRQIRRMIERRGGKVGGIIRV